MATWTAWLALAGLGALHGLNPLCGWPLLAARGLRRGLLAMAAGHALSLLLVAALVVCGIERWWLLPLGAGALLARPRHGPALLSFLTATFHGTGLMLVPALVPLCMAGTPAREIVATRFVAAGACRAAGSPGGDAADRRRAEGRDRPCRKYPACNCRGVSSRRFVVVTGSITGATRPVESRPGPDRITFVATTEET